MVLPMIPGMPACVTRMGTTDTRLYTVLILACLSSEAMKEPRPVARDTSCLIDSCLRPRRRTECGPPTSTTAPEGSDHLGSLASVSPARLRCRDVASSGLACPHRSAARQSQPANAAGRAGLSDANWGLPHHDDLHPLPKTSSPSAALGFFSRSPDFLGPASASRALSPSHDSTACSTPPIESLCARSTLFMRGAIE